MGLEFYVNTGTTSTATGFYDIVLIFRTKPRITSVQQIYQFLCGVELSKKYGNFHEKNINDYFLFSTSKTFFSDVIWHFYKNKSLFSVSQKKRRFHLES